MGDEPLINDNAGAKALIASVLTLALQDYANSGGCPEGCLFVLECPQWKSDTKYQEAKAFIHSDWCGALCEGVEVAHEAYLNACRNKAGQECRPS
jgi:hypothetical protein